MADNANFFQSPQAAAVYKHRLLREYIPPFVGKTGSVGTGHVVVYDAYSGPGRYGDEQPGSPELLVDTAVAMAKLRNVTTVFSERDQDYCDRLQTLMTEKGVDPETYEIRRGSVEKHLDDVVASAGDDPLFVFLDPFGLTISFAELVRLITMRRRAGTPYQPVTEVLMNFSYEAVRRIAGVARSDKDYKAKAAQIAKLDVTLGGDWWHALAEEQPEGWVPAILAGFASRVRNEVKGGYITASVADSLRAQPVYELILFTQHRDGLWTMMTAMAKARGAWRAWLRDHQDQQTIAGLEFEDDENAWVDEIAANINRVLTDQGAFVVQDELLPVFGRAFGVAWETHVTKALKKLKADGLISQVPIGKKQYARVQR